MNTSPTMADFQKGMRALHGDGGGALTLQIVRPTEAIHLMAIVRFGDELAAALLSGVKRLLIQVERAPKGKPIQCGRYHRPFRSGEYNFAVAVSTLDDPQHALGIAVCVRCACTADMPGFRRKAIDCFRGVWPDMREIAITAGGGAA